MKQLLEKPHGTLGAAEKGPQKQTKSMRVEIKFQGPSRHVNLRRPEIASIKQAVERGYRARERRWCCGAVQSASNHDSAAFEGGRENLVTTKTFATAMMKPSLLAGEEKKKGRKEADGSHYSIW